MSPSWRPIRLLGAFLPVLFNLLTLQILFDGKSYYLSNAANCLQKLFDEGLQIMKSNNFGSDNSEPTVAVFYNMYTAKEADIPRVSALVREQLEPLQDQTDKLVFSPLYINSIGAIENLEQLNLFTNATSNNTPEIKFAHMQQGDEGVTLQQLWEFCRRNDTHPNQTVTYLHSKGSFHSTQANDLLRKYLTKGALSQDCTNMPPQQCNVCSSRMSPFPHPHTSGNMWTARCDYIAKLYEPKEFEVAMRNSPQRRAFHQAVVGRGRFAYEHWVHSHPHVQPCDVDDSSNYIWNYDGVPLDFSIRLQPAPRFPFESYLKDSGRVCRKTDPNGRREERLSEYLHLYNISVPPETWFGWKLFQGMPENWDWIRQDIPRPMIYNRSEAG